MSFTGIVLFVIFLLVTNLVDKKKRKERRQKPHKAEGALADLPEAAQEPQALVERQDLLRRFFLALPQESETEGGQQAAVYAAATSVSPHEEARGGQVQEATEVQPPQRAMALDVAPAAMLQAVVLAEVIGRPKAQCRRSPYFRP